MLVLGITKGDLMNKIATYYFWYWTAMGWAIGVYLLPIR